MATPKLIRKRGVTFAVDAEAACSMKDCPPDWYTQWWEYTYRTWEPHTFRIFDALLESNHSYIDVGGWIGPTVLYAAAKARHVYCLEPDPEAFRVLSANIGVHPHRDRITVAQAALSDRSGSTPLGSRQLGNSESTILLRGNTPDGSASSTAAQTIVTMVTMDELERRWMLEGCNFMKVDIEGGEKIVIPAIASFLERRRPSLYLSLHWMHLTADEIEGLLDVLFDIYPVVYDETLRRRIDRATVLNERLSAIVCLPHDFSTLKKALIRLATIRDLGAMAARNVAMPMWHRLQRLRVRPA